MDPDPVPRTVRVGELDVPRIGLGTNRLTPTRENLRFLRDAVAAGLRLIDTAHLYTGGGSEEAIGEALAPFPDGLVVATKGGYRPGEGRPEVLHRQIEDSLRRLRTDRIELYYLHRVDPQTPLEVSLGAIREHVERGEIAHVGLSEVGEVELERAQRILPIVAVQDHFNLGERRWEPVVDVTARQGIVFVPFFPLRGGESPALRRIAQRLGATPSQVALAWELHRSPNVGPIPGTLSLEHLRENLAALDLRLTAEDIAALA